MNTLEQIQALQKQLRDVRAFRNMRECQDCHKEIAAVRNKSLSFELCWQASHGSKNYHTTNEASLEGILAEALDVDVVLVRAEELLTNRIAKLRLSREQELRAELDEIEKLKFTIS